MMLYAVLIHVIIIYAMNLLIYLRIPLNIYCTTGSRYSLHRRHGISNRLLR